MSGRLGPRDHPKQTDTVRPRSLDALFGGVVLAQDCGAWAQSGPAERGQAHPVGHALE